MDARDYEPNKRLIVRFLLTRTRCNEQIEQRSIRREIGSGGYGLTKEKGYFHARSP